MTKKRMPLILGFASALCCISLVLIVLLNPQEAEAPPTRVLDKSAARDRTATPSVPSDTAMPTPTKTPELTQSPEDRLKAVVQSALRAGNRDVPRLQQFSLQGGAVQVTWSINDNLNTDWIISGAKRDAVDILEAISESDIPYEQAHLVGTFSMKDIYGNVEETPVINVTYLKTTLDKINWQNFDSGNVFLLADVVVFLHPEFSQ